MKTKTVLIKGKYYQIEAENFITLNGTVARFKWFKYINAYSRQMVTKDFIRGIK